MSFSEVNNFNEMHNSQQDGHLDPDDMWDAFHNRNNYEKNEDTLLRNRPDTAENREIIFTEGRVNPDDLWDIFHNGNKYERSRNIHEGGDVKSSFEADKGTETENNDNSKSDNMEDVQQNQDDSNDNNNNEINLDKRAETSPENVKFDDNGKVYRKDNELIPNNTYEINGYIYKTDEKGRPISAEGKLQPKDHEGKRTITDKMNDIGKGDQKDTDDRGHLIGDQFNGSPSLENLVPQDAKLNQGKVKELENSLAKAVRDGKEVYLKVEPNYSGDSYRPDSFTYTYTVDGEKSVKIFKNGE